MGDILSVSRDQYRSVVEDKSKCWLKVEPMSRWVTPWPRKTVVQCDHGLSRNRIGLFALSCDVVCIHWDYNGSQSSKPMGGRAGGAWGTCSVAKHQTSRVFHGGAVLGRIGGCWEPILGWWVTECRATIRHEGAHFLTVPFRPCYRYRKDRSASLGAFRNGKEYSSKVTKWN